MSLASERRAAVDRAFPGVICSRVTLGVTRFAPGSDNAKRFAGGYSYTLAICAKASAAVLVAHGLVTQGDIDKLPPSGKVYGLRRLADGTYQASLHWWDGHDGTTKARDMAARIGVTYQPKEQNRTLEVSGRCVRWTTTGNVIRPDWNWLRQKVELARMEAQA